MAWARLASVIPLAGMIQASGYRRAFLVFGLIQGLSIFHHGSLPPQTRGAETPCNLTRRPDRYTSFQKHSAPSVLDDLPGLRDDRFRRYGDHQRNSDRSRSISASRSRSSPFSDYLCPS
jgi:hypothetical protein